MQPAEHIYPKVGIVCVAVFSASAACPMMCRSILCNSTNNPFGGTGGSADIGGGNGMRAGKALLC